MSPEQRQRYAFLGLAVLLHFVVFLALYHYIIFPAPPPEAAVSEFYQFAVPARALPPPATPPATASLPNFTPVVPAPRPVSTPIVTNMRSTFEVPKLDTVALAHAMDHVPTSQPDTNPSNNTPAAVAANPGTGSGTGNGTGSGAGASDSYAQMDAALKGDSRDGEIVGICSTKTQPATNAAAIDDIRQRLLIIIGWYVDDPALDQGQPGIKHGSAVPILSQHLEVFDNAPNTFGDIQIAMGTLNGRLKNTKIKTVVLISNFRNVDLNPTSDNVPHDTLGVRLEIAELNKLISLLRARGIRLCAISFENPPFPALAAYIAESGGIVLYPRGVPTDKIATQLKNTAIAP